MKEETAVELLKLATQISAGKFKTPASGKANTDEVLAETLSVPLKHFNNLKSSIA